jgi:hypothetical protein
LAHDITQSEKSETGDYMGPRMKAALVKSLITQKNYQIFHENLYRTRYQKGFDLIPHEQN